MVKTIKEIDQYFKKHKKEAKEAVEILLATLDEGNLITVTRAGTTQYVIQKEDGNYYMDVFLLETMEPIRTQITEKDAVDIFSKGIVVNYQSCGEMLSKTADGGYIFYNNFGVA